jgi:sugar (pentulose or hexulose) kinase
MAERTFLAIDLGAESGRVVKGTLSSRIDVQEVYRFDTASGQLNGHHYWDVLALWEHVKAGTKAGRATSKEALSGVAVDTWGVDFGLLDEAGNLLSYPFHYRDPWTSDVFEKAIAHVGGERIYEATGNQLQRINTLYQLLALRESGPRILEIASVLLFMPDLFTFFLCGEKKAELTIAATSQMFDTRKRRWARALLREFDLPEHILPEVAECGTMVGTLRQDVAVDCDCEPMPVFATAAHDTASAVAAVPAEGADWCYISSGTWSLMGVELTTPLINHRTLELNYTNELGACGTVRFLKNIVGLWLVQECRKAWRQQGHNYTYSQLEALARTADGFDSVLDPSYASFFLPGEMPKKIAEFCRNTRQRIPETPAEFVRTCLNTLAVCYRDTLKNLESVVGRMIQTIHIVGGGSQNSLLNQMTADACERSVVAGPVEATAIGNILVQAIAAGAVDSLAAGRALIRDSCDVSYSRPNHDKSWELLHSRYLEILARKDAQ